VPASGVLTLGGKKAVYDSVSRDDQVYAFTIRGKLDPDLFPIAAGTTFTASTSRLLPGDDFTLPGDGTINLRQLPTRDRMWAPVAQVDARHVQNTFGALVRLDADISTEAYLRRVQGVWFALMDGPFLRNVYSGLQLTMGLPVARTAGTVTELRDEYDALGKLTRRVAVIGNDRQSIEHDLDPGVGPSIDWSVHVGDTVETFERLTTGVEVADFQSDPLWYKRFPGVSELQRFNSFGVFLDTDVLNADSDINSAIRFALRIKPKHTQLFMRFLLTSGNENLSEEIDDDVFACQVPSLGEDMTFDEGEVPADPNRILHLGQGHKLGQHKHLGVTGNFHTMTIGTYTSIGHFTGDGATTGGSQTFTSAGAHSFTSEDIGRLVVVGDLEARQIQGVTSSTQVIVSAPFPQTATGLAWELRDYLVLGAGFHLGTINAFSVPPGDENLPTEMLWTQQVVSMSMKP
jgi:hypothetical protein